MQIASRLGDLRELKTTKRCSVENNIDVSNVSKSTCVDCSHRIVDCRLRKSVDYDAVAGHSDDWLPPHKSPFKTFFNIFHHAAGRSIRSNVVCLPKVFRINVYDPTSGFSTAMYYDGNGTRKVSHIFSEHSMDEWNVNLYHPDSHTADSYTFNKTVNTRRSNN